MTFSEFEVQLKLILHPLHCPSGLPVIDSKLKRIGQLDGVESAVRTIQDADSLRKEVKYFKYFEGEESAPVSAGDVLDAMRFLSQKMIEVSHPFGRVWASSLSFWSPLQDIPGFFHTDPFTRSCAAFGGIANLEVLEGEVRVRFKEHSRPLEIQSPEELVISVISQGELVLMDENTVHRAGPLLKSGLTIFGEIWFY